MIPVGGSQHKNVALACGRFLFPVRLLNESIQQPSIKQKTLTILSGPRFCAEREGFEPPEPLGSTVFKTAAIDRSAISPGQR